MAIHLSLPAGLALPQNAISEAISIGCPSRQVVVDSCVVGAPSAFLQQAAHLTGGVYLCPARPAGLLQYLLMVRQTLLSSACIA